MRAAASKASVAVETWSVFIVLVNLQEEGSGVGWEMPGELDAIIRFAGSEEEIKQKASLS
jgi:hypothetical protein